MPFPKKKLTKDDLRHPKDKRSSFNGEKRRPDSEQGFAKAGRVSSVEGTRPSSNIKPVEMASLNKPPTASTRDRTGAKPYPKKHAFTPAFQPDLKALTENQKRMKWKK